MTTAGYKKYTIFFAESNIENETTHEIATTVMEDEEPDQAAKWIPDKWNGAPNGFRDDT